MNTIATNGENKEINLTSNTGNVNILASKNVIDMSSNTESNSYSFGGGVGLTGPTGLNVGFNKSTSDTKAYLESYSNSSIQNKNSSINIRTKNTNDADKGNVSVIGANIEGKDINIDVANNLIVESLQNKEYSNTKSENYGGTVGNSLGGFSANYGNGFDKKERNWVDNQTSIIGNNSVVINTKNNTDIKGAVIASGSYEDVDIPETEWTTDITSGETAKTKRVFKDNGNLVLNTGSLTYSDIYDNNTEKNQNLNVGLGTTINFGFSNGGTDIEQTTKATIGNGKITIGGHTLTDSETITQDGTIVAKSEENIGINRDVNNSQEITKNETTGGWNIDVSVNVLELLDLIDKGPEQYTKDQINKAKENINKVKEQINKFKDIVVDVTKSIVDKFKDNGSNVITEDDIRQIIENNKDSIDEMAKQYVNLNETDLTEEQVKAILTKLLLEQGITLALNGSLEGLGITKDYLERGGLIALVQAIETQGGTRFENLNWYATDENGELFKKAVQCTSSTSCYQINNDNSKTKLTCNNGNCTGKDSDGNQINITIKVDKNGKPIKVLSPAYIPSTGKYDAMSLGKIHWAGNKGGQDRGLDYLLQDAKTNYPEFYNDYIKIAGTDENGKPITDTTNMTTSQLKELKTFIKSYDTEDFKNYEVKAAERIYFTEPVSKLPTEVQDRINNSPLIVQQIIMSTYVQLGDKEYVNTRIIESFSNSGNTDYKAILDVIKLKDGSYSNRANLERQALKLFYQLQKGKK